jgi:Carboxypeptidase regulatory-like domain/TonB-dependent Receptor Plug Domain
MRFSLRGVLFLLAILFVGTFIICYQAVAQSSSGTIQGVVKDPSGAVVAGARVEISDPVSGLHRESVTGSAGDFRLVNIPFNPYHMVVRAGKFAPYSQDVEVRSLVPVTLEIKLGIEATTTVTVEGAADLIETDPTFHTDVDRSLFDKLPLESTSSSVSALVTQTSPGIAADSNGLFHGLGDHAENSFSVDGQPITDQQSKVFSNQIPLDSIESLEVIAGAPPAEFGDKTSVVINVTTRSGMGQNTPKGSFTASYGSFGTSSAGFNVAYGGQEWGNFISVSGLESGRFLDPPEIVAIHDKGNQENVFNRFDFQLSTADTIHLNAGFTRSWFQTPNAFDNLNLTDQSGNPVGSTDQRSQIRTFNLAPSWTRLINANTVFNFGLFVRHDEYNYYPSGNPFADDTPLQQETISQTRMLTNLGARSDVSYVRNGHNVKAGITYQQTLLRENDGVGIVDPNFLSSISPSCLDGSGNPIAGTECATLAPFDLTRTGGTLFPFVGRADIKELSLYAQDTISKGNWTFNVGLRGDLYNGLSSHKEAEPRLGISYNFKPSNTVLRVSYARVLETPFNENLVLSDVGCANAVLAPLLLCTPGVSGTLSPGWRNEFHAGFQQAFGKYLVFSGEYIWKYTHNGYDFSVLGATPITFPIEWHNSKIPGYAGRVAVPNYRGFSAQFVFSSVSARFFPPQIGGAGATVGQGGLPFRIDHDERFNESTHLQYQVGKRGPWLGFNWRYDSGLVAGAVPFAADTTTPVDLTGLTADQQMQAGLFCGNVFPTLTTPLTTCAPSQYGSTRLTIPAPGTENDDKNPPRIAPRNLFDASIGHDNLFNGDRYKWSLRFTAINLTNKVALYNFLSTFSGTHFVTPRTESVELGFHF